MRAKGVLLTIVVVLGLLFAVLNWQQLFEERSVNLLLGRAQVPLGISLLGLLLMVSLLFFLAALFERAGQLRQVTHQERLIENLQNKLDRKRSAEMESLESALRDRTDELKQLQETGIGHLEVNLRGAMEELEVRQGQRLAQLEERVLLVRNELAADIAELEDRLQRALDLPSLPSEGS